MPLTMVVMVMATTIMAIIALIYTISTIVGVKTNMYSVKVMKDNCDLVA